MTDVRKSDRNCASVTSAHLPKREETAFAHFLRHQNIGTLVIFMNLYIDKKQF